MRRLDVLNVGKDRLRWGPWRGDERLAYLVPVPGRSLSRLGIEQALTVIGDHGYQGVLTAALGHTELAPFTDVGFRPHERLHLLRHDLRVLPDRPALPLRPARRRHRADVLAVDGAAFDPFWRFDDLGIEEARRATPFTRFRIHADGDGVAGYAITGRTNDVAYLQRLAVRPDHQGRGIGWALVADALHWARRRRTTTMLVNTQEVNRTALHLYERIGFRLEDHGLTVLWRSLQPEGAPALVVGGRT